MDLPLILTIKQDLSALNSRPAQVTAVVHQESKFWTAETVEDIKFRSSMKAHNKGNLVLLVVNIGTLTCKMLIPAKKRIIERVQSANIPC